MQLRPFACPRAARTLTPPSTQHIWVSDELLAQAFNRYLRVRSHRVRHGSSVPGPLEAQRRGLKRRMTVAATPQAPPGPPTFSLGALFGFGASKPDRPLGYEPPLRYEPPSIGVAKEPWYPPSVPSLAVDFPSLHLPASAPAPPAETPSPDPPIPEQPRLSTQELLVQSLDQIHKETSVAEVVGLVEDFIHSKRHDEYLLILFEHLCQKWEGNRVLEFICRDGLLLPVFGTKGARTIVDYVLSLPLPKLDSSRKLFRDFLEKASREMTRHEKQELENPLPSKNDMHSSVLTCALDIVSSGEATVLAHSGAALASHPVLRMLLHLRKEPFQAPKQIAAWVADLPVSKNRSRMGKKTHHLIRVLKAVPASRLAGWVKPVTLQLSNQLIHGRSLALCKNRVEMWLQILQNVGRGGQEHVAAEVMNDLFFKVYDALASQGLRSQELKTRLANLEPSRVALLFTHWTLNHPLFQESKGADSRIQARRCREFLSSELGQDLPLDDILAQLFLHFRKCSIPHSKIFAFTVEFLYHRQRNGEAAISFLKKVAEGGGKIPSMSILGQFVSSVLEETHPSAMHFIGEIRALGIKTDDQSPLEPHLGALANRQKFKYIINRAKAWSITPTDLANIPLDLLLPSHTALIHQLAYQYSLDHSRPCRAVQRAVYPLYRYLRDNHLPIEPLFTRAVVRIYLARPLSERKWVSSKRAEIICNLVEEVEGTKVADHIRDEVWKWRGHLIRLAKARLMELGGDGPARVSTMRRLQLL